jgi:adenylate cyclase
VLEGSVRRSGDRLRITAQLIDAVTGAHRWAERYDRELVDVFAVQDEGAIVTIIAAHVNRAEIERALYEARRLLEQSLAIDPDYARAAAALSDTHVAAYVEPYDDDYHSPAALDHALELAETAARLDPRLPQARAQLGMILLLKHQHDDAIAEFERALALNANFIDHRYAHVLTCAGEPARAIEVLEANIRLDPFAPPLFSSGYMGLANYMLKRYPEAVRWLRECALRLPNMQLPRVWLASAYAQAGQLEEARKEAAEVLRINPSFTIERYKPLLLHKSPKDLEHRLDGLRKAGLPES